MFLFYLIYTISVGGVFMKKQDIIKQNQLAWDKKATEGNPWSTPVSKEEINQAREGIFNIKLTARKYVPRNWFPENLKNAKILFKSYFTAYCLLTLGKSCGDYFLGSFIG